MSYSLSSDFQEFIDNRLNCAGDRLKNNTNYKLETHNIETHTRKLLAAMPLELAVSLEDINDSYLEILSISERVVYQQGFKDALRLIAEF